MVGAHVPWLELDFFVSDLRIKKPYLQIWPGIERNPPSIASIDVLLEHGYVVEERPLNLLLGTIEYPKIVLQTSLDPYERDKTLFHELAHLHHPVLLCLGDSYSYFSEREQLQREAITEWLGRKARADPELLRHAIVSFGLEPHVYDQASYRAFKDLVKQPASPFIDNVLLMD